MSYRYITENNLYNKQTYMYSEYGGIDFLKEYINSRKAYLNTYTGIENCTVESNNEPIDLNDVMQELLYIREALQENNRNDKVMDLLNEYTKSFEVRKRIYQEYTKERKPTEGSGFENYETYVIFAECLALSYRYTQCLKYFSCLLKVNDTLLSVQNELDIGVKGRLYHIIKSELLFFNQLMEENGINWEE